MRMKCHFSKWCCFGWKRSKWWLKTKIRFWSHAPVYPLSLQGKGRDLLFLGGSVSESLLLSHTLSFHWRNNRSVPHSAPHWIQVHPLIGGKLTFLFTWNWWLCQSSNVKRVFELFGFDDPTDCSYWQHSSSQIELNHRAVLRFPLNMNAPHKKR